MAKSKWNGSTIRVICTVVITILVLLGVAGGWYDHKANIDKVADKTIQQDKDITRVKVEGCNPSKKNTISVAVLIEKLDGFETAQTANKDEILRAIGEISK